MRFPWTLTASMTTYIAGKRLRGAEKFPLVMMLEPLHACNLTCTGCGRIREYADTIREKLTVEQCLNALEECGADVRWAKVSTLGASVVDAFGLAGAGGEGTLGRAERQAIETAVLTAAG